MAEDSREEQTDGTAVAPGTSARGLSKPLPPGVVLGPDGKPYVPAPSFSSAARC